MSNQNWILLFFVFYTAHLFAQELSPMTLAPDGPRSKSIDQASYEQYMNSRFTLFTHERNYILPISYVDNPTESLYVREKLIEPTNHEDYYSNVESEFQISFFLPVARKMQLFESDWDLLFAYTHHAWWQIYNGAWSRPFRETNYTPEVFLRQINENSNFEILGLKSMGYDLGYVHESNGEIQILSRSWNRLFGRAYFVANDTIVALTGWLKLPETVSDDNADIQMYKGIGSIEIQKTFGLHTVELETLMAARPGFELRYSYPWKEGLRWFVDVKYGYGQSLIEYDIETRRIALGFTLENFLDPK
jgi:phospholipase A1/A2